jgi:LPXTG-site transpeptidase (sortase) family protein
MNINWRVALLLVFVLSACGGQNPPVIGTLAENTTLTSTSATAPSETQPPFINTLQSPEITQTNTPDAELRMTPTIISSVDVSSLGAPTVDTPPSVFIPVTGQTQASNNNENTDKFKNFEIPVIGESGAFLIPTTGFPPGMMTRIKTDLPSSLNSITPKLEIPALKLSMPILGIPLSNNTWDVSWLWDQAGWLEGTAYPTMKGNSVLTAHVVTADGKNGPFVHLKSLTSDDYVFVINSGFRYIYGIDTINFVKPNDVSVFSHEDDSWLTLITCDSYDEKTKEYLLRVVVRAQLVEMQEIK